MPMRALLLDALRVVPQPHPEYQPGQSAAKGWEQLAEIVAAATLLDELRKP